VPALTWAKSSSQVGYVLRLTLSCLSVTSARLLIETREPRGSPKAPHNRRLGSIACAARTASIEGGPPLRRVERPIPVTGGAPLGQLCRFHRKLCDPVRLLVLPFRGGGSARKLFERLGLLAESLAMEAAGWDAAEDAGYGMFEGGDDDRAYLDEEGNSDKSPGKELGEVRGPFPSSPGSSPRSVPSVSLGNTVGERFPRTTTPHTPAGRCARGLGRCPCAKDPVASVISWERGALVGRGRGGSGGVGGFVWERRERQWQFLQRRKRERGGQPAWVPRGCCCHDVAWQGPIGTRGQTRRSHALDSEGVRGMRRASETTGGGVVPGGGGGVEGTCVAGDCHGGVAIGQGGLVGAAHCGAQGAAGRRREGAGRGICRRWAGSTSPDDARRASKGRRSPADAHNRPHGGGTAVDAGHGGRHACQLPPHSCPVQE